MIINENTPIGDFYAIDYCHGRCELFAIATNEFLSKHNIKNEIWCFMEFEDLFIPDLVCLDHAFLKIGDQYFDAKGFRTLEEIENEYTANSMEPELVDQMFFKNWYSENLRENRINDFCENEKENIFSFLKTLFSK